MPLALPTTGGAALKFFVFISLMFLFSEICLSVPSYLKDARRCFLTKPKCGRVVVKAHPNELVILGVDPNDDDVYSWQISGAWFGHTSSKLRVYPLKDMRVYLTVQRSNGDFDTIEYVVIVGY